SPGVNVCGVVSPEMLNPLPVALTDLIATLAEPPLVKRSGCVTGLPTLTLPKLTTDGVTLRRLVDPDVLTGLLNPTHPDIATNPNIASRTKKFFAAIVVRLAAGRKNP